MEWSKRQIQRRGLTSSPLVIDAVAECEILLEQSRAALYRHAELTASGAMFDQLDVQDTIAQCAFVKYVCTNNAASIMSKLVDVVGGATYARKLPFERMWRDVQAGLFMPFANHPARELIGSSALGIAMAPAIGGDETGVDSKPKEAVAAASTTGGQS